VHSHRGTEGNARLTESIDQSPRRSLTVVVTLVVGSVLLAATLRAPSGSTSFFVVGFFVAGTWIAGSLISGPIPLEAIRSSRLGLVIGGLALGGVAFLAFLMADLLGRHLPLISNALRTVLTKADAGPMALVLAVALLNGLGEELFFRGALFDVLGSRNPVASSLVVYVAVTATTENVALIVAAVVMGSIFTLQRARSGGILASTMTHLCWTTLMVLAFPR
jgi:membrane protease YdiL (CAAX protease family)